MRKLQESGAPREVDLERTDELPVLNFANNDDALDLSSTARLEVNVATGEHDRHIDLPSLVESVQNAEARIAQQSAQQESLERELKEARDKADFFRNETQKGETDALTLRKALEAREAALSQALQSLAERDRQTEELRRDQSQTSGKLQSVTQAGQKLTAELNHAQARIEEKKTELAAAQRSIDALHGQIKRGEHALSALQLEAETHKRNSAEFLENLRSLEWRRGDRENLASGFEARLAAAAASAERSGALVRDLTAKLESAQEQLTERGATVRALEAAIVGNTENLKAQTLALQASEQTRQELLLQLKARDAAQSKADAERISLDESVRRLQEELTAERSSHVQLQTRATDIQTAHQELQSRLADTETRAETAEKELEIRIRDASAASHALQTLQQESTRTLESARADAAHAMETAQAEAIRTLEAARGEAARAFDTAQAEAARTLETTRAEAARALETAQSEAIRSAQLAERLAGELSRASAELASVRRPIEDAEAEIARLGASLDSKAHDLGEAEGEIKRLQAALERSRGALEEREFLIRRLERSATNNAQVLGRLQSSIERLGAPSHLLAPPPEEHRVSLSRLDEGASGTHNLGARTRIGRAPDNDVRIESTSVSRHHALILTGARHAIIEDLGSTNGVIVNDRKVARHKLKDGDVVIIGEAKFRFSDTGSLSPAPNPVSFAPTERA